MAKPRNNITKMPAKTRIQIARWILNGIGYDEIRRRLADADPELIVPHNTSFAAFERSDEFREIRERVLFEDQRNRELNQYWDLVSGEDGLNSAVKGTIFLLLRQAHEAASTELDTNEIGKLIRSLTQLQKAETLQALSDSKRQIDAIEQEHAAEVAALQAQIAELRNENSDLRTVIANAGLDAAGNAGDEFSEAEKARARKLYGLK